MYFLNISGYLSVSWVWMKTFSSGLDWIWRNSRSRGACKKPVFWKSSWRGGVEDTRSCEREGVSECPCWTSWSSWGKFQLAFISPDTENHLILQGSLQHSFIQWAICRLKSCSSTSVQLRCRWCICVCNGCFAGADSSMNLL